MSEKRLYHKVAKRIADLIDAGTYPAGSKLPSERELSEEFGVCRTVVREAEIALEAVGRLYIRVGAGVYVRNDSDLAAESRLNASVLELTQARLLFEPECAALAATQISELELEKLGQSVVGIELGPLAGVDGGELDQDFHLQIARASGNKINEHIVESLWRIHAEIEFSQSLVAVNSTEETDHRHNEHIEIYEALSARDPNKARHAMRLHCQNVLTNLIEKLERQSIEEVRDRASANRERFMFLTTAK